MLFTATATSAGQTADDDTEERDDRVKDGLQSGRDGVDDGHDTVADRAEDGLDLVGVSGGQVPSVKMNVRKKLRHPCLRLCDVRSMSIVDFECGGRRSSCVGRVL